MLNVKTNFVFVESRFCRWRLNAVIFWVKGREVLSRLLLFLSKSRINRLPFLNTSSRCCLKDFTARRRRTNSENKKEKEERDRGGHVHGYSWSRSNSILSILILLHWAFFSPLLPLAHYLTPPLYVPSPLTFFPLCSFLFSLTPLFILTLSPSIWWNSAADNACNWSDSHFSSVFGPDKEYCQHFADMASAGRIKWTLFCSVCSKLKASQFICSCLRLTGASHSHRNTVEMGEEENKRDFPLPQETPVFLFCSRLHSATLRWRRRENERSRLVV